MDDNGAIISALRSCDVLLQLNGFRVKKVSYNLKSQKLSQYLKQLSKHYHVTFKLVTIGWNRLGADHLPLSYQSSATGEYTVLAKLDEDKALIQRSTQSTPEVISLEELEKEWPGTAIVNPKRSLNFDIRWFIPEFSRHKKLLFEVLSLSLLLQLLALALPLFFQVVMDKVLVHQALATLDVLVVVLLIVGLFEVILKGLREYVFVHTTNRIDIRLGLKLFQHLINLPLSFFKARQVGLIVARMSELDSIRSLLTGSALTLFVDVPFLFVFLGVMFYLSESLTLIVMAFIPVYIAIAWLTAKPLEKRIEHQFKCGAENSAFLTETIIGCETVKSLAIEPVFQRKYEEQTQEVVKANFSTQKLQLGVNQLVNMLQRLATVVVI
jgi:ATP-binding cassette subfamily B protein RtxB